MVALDTETTGTDVEADRIVQFAAVKIGESGVMNTINVIVNPGVDIPAEATAIHGITNERARAGIEPAAMLAKVDSVLASAWGHGLPVVAMNATFDLTLIDREMRRHGLGGIDGARFGRMPVIDPLVIDRAIDKYRKGSRKLVDLAAHYQVKCADAHDALGDCLTAARVLWKMLRIDYTVVSFGGGQRTRQVDYSPLRDLTLDELQPWQAKAHRDWATHYQEYLRTKTVPPVPDAVIDTSWPLRRAALTTTGGTTT